MDYNVQPHANDTLAISDKGAKRLEILNNTSIFATIIQLHHLKLQMTSQNYEPLLGRGIKRQRHIWR